MRQLAKLGSSSIHRGLCCLELGWLGSLPLSALSSVEFWVPGWSGSRAPASSNHRGQRFRKEKSLSSLCETKQPSFLPPFSPSSPCLPSSLAFFPPSFLFPPSLLPFFPASLPSLLSPRNSYQETKLKAKITPRVY